MKEYFNSLVGVRGIAILAVLVFHLDKRLLPNGFLGVDIFFTLSGFVVMHSVHGKLQQNKFSFLQFAIRRWNRLQPPLIFITVLTQLAMVFLIIPAHAKQLFYSSMTALIGVQNLWLIRINTDYFGISGEMNPFTHTWSLSLEEQFYLIFAITVVISNNFFKKFSLQFITLIFSIMSIASLLIYSLEVDPNVQFYSPLSRCWQLLSGCVLALLCHRPSFVKHLSPKKLLEFGPDLVFLLLFLILFIPPVGSFIVSLATLMAIIFLVSYDRLGHTYRARLSNRVLCFFGKRAYSIYLIHWPVIVFFNYYFPESYLFRFIMIVLIFLLSEVTYYLFERKFVSVQ